MSSISIHGIATKICPQCGFEGELIDALFVLTDAAQLVPMTLLSLRKFLSRQKEQYPPVYGHYGPQRRRYRLVTGDEVRRIRARLIAGPKRSSLDDLFRRAMAPSNKHDGGANDGGA